MSAFETAIVTQLNNDATLTALLTGGVYAQHELPPLGIQRDQLSDAFDANGRVLPLAVVQVRNENRTSRLFERGQRQYSTVQRILITITDHENATYDTITSARERIAFLLDKAVIDNRRIAFMFDALSQRDYMFNQAPYEQTEYEAIRIRSI